mgnify:CR=1 FL=1
MDETNKQCTSRVPFAAFRSLSRSRSQRSAARTTAVAQTMWRAVVTLRAVAASIGHAVGLLDGNRLRGESAASCACRAEITYVHSDVKFLNSFCTMVELLWYSPKNAWLLGWLANDGAACFTTRPCSCRIACSVANNLLDTCVASVQPKTIICSTTTGGRTSAGRRSRRRCRGANPACPTRR